MNKTNRSQKINKKSFFFSSINGRIFITFKSVRRRKNVFYCFFRKKKLLTYKNTSYDLTYTSLLNILAGSFRQKRIYFKKKIFNKKQNKMLII